MATRRLYSDSKPLEQWTNATQPTDPAAAGYTAWDAGGNVTTQRALTSDEAATLAAQDTAVTTTTNAATVDANLTAFITSLQLDVAQDNTIIANANTVIATSGTQSTLQLSNTVRQLAQAVKTLASNDINNKRVLSNLLRKIQGNYTDLTGT